MDIVSFLASDNYIVLNRDLIKLLGLQEAVLLCELCSEYKYWDINGGIEDGCFYSTIENIEDKTGLSRFQQDKAFVKLKEQGFVELVLKGMPAKRYIRINLEKIQFAIFQQPSLRESSNQVCEKVATKNNKYKNNNKNNSKEKYKKESFKPNDRWWGPMSELKHDPNTPQSDELF